MRILFLDLDTLRADHLGCYGYHRQTSPHIDRIAEEGIRFTNYYCSDAPCLPSRAALISGRFGIQTGVVGHGGTAADMRLEGKERGFRSRFSQENLTSVVRSAGLKTISISPFAERHSAWWFYAGFQEIYNTGKGGMESAEDITPTVLDWLKAHGREDNWFLHINYWDPHTPYRAPQEFGNPFQGNPLPDWPTEEVIRRHQKLAGPHTAQEINMWDDSTNPAYPRHPGAVRNRDDLRRLIDGYDCGIRYLDSHIGKIFNTLAQLGIEEETAVIISADHGENMGELGIYAEHATADLPTCRIPMLIYWPGGRSGLVDHSLHYNLDLAPTLAEMLGREVPSVWEGKSYSKTLLAGESVGHRELILSQCAHVCQRSVRFDEWLYIRTHHDGFHLFPAEMLFNIKGDPREENNLAPDRPEVVREAAYRLHNWRDRILARMEEPVDPLWTVIKEGGPFHARGALAAYCARLEKTGRGHLISELKARHPQEFK